MGRPPAGAPSTNPARRTFPEILENAENDLTLQMRNFLELLRNEWQMVDQQIEGFGPPTRTSR